MKAIFRQSFTRDLKKVKDGALLDRIKQAIERELIVTIKHPVMAGRELDVQAALTAPDEIRLSRSDPDVYLFYKSEGMKRWVCAVTKRLDGDGFLITTYPTDAIKEGERLWPE